MATAKRIKIYLVFLLAAFILIPVFPLQAQESITHLRQLLPVASKFVFINKGADLSYYQGFDQNNALVGVVFTASGLGYSGIIEAGASMSLDGRILAIKIIKQEESPGLGSRGEELLFLNQFLNRKPEDFDSIKAVSGATTSSKAVVDMVRKKAQLIAADLK